MGAPERRKRKPSQKPGDRWKERRWCSRCERDRIFQVRVRPNGRRQPEYLACKRRRQRYSPTYNSWRNMLDRCLNPNAVNYKYYGGDGVRVHEPWVESFQAFLADVGERPEGKTLDRKDPEGDYVPDNVRWATAKQQIDNRRGSYHVNYKSKRKSYDQDKPSKKRRKP